MKRLIDLNLNAGLILWIALSFLHFQAAHQAVLFLPVCYYLQYSQQHIRDQLERWSKFAGDTCLVDLKSTEQGKKIKSILAESPCFLSACLRLWRTKTFFRNLQSWVSSIIPRAQGDWWDLRCVCWRELSTSANWPKCFCKNTSGREF